MHRTPRRLAAAAAALALGAALTACAGQSGTSAPSAPVTTEAASDVAGHNDADTVFAQMMIVHHEGAIEMAALAVERASDPEVVALAERIEAAQAPEIALMSGWLEARGEDVSPRGHEGMDHDGMQMEGMEHGEAMGVLDDLDGDAFDQRFLELMIAHHEGAVVMSEAQLEDGENPDALELARTIIDDQTTEIAEMQGMLTGS
ncbi:DUF305 domain-containing protein [Cellulomonas phragmiteti]|uniref:DUF305 domain-containing protein n=1 Tax=Cellulomonas phragmiteti TaxID=478780 RepID=A0ABQ4DMQ5_9CELL|nr:DUF305 domain-containing protein [Cellulomonas phragmiteti]GIG40616.1 hypothetical protein Cph01nite_23780 [Cellulomonas phragmiteti]